MKTKTKTTTMKTIKTTMVKTTTIKWLETKLHQISFLPLPITSSSKTPDVLVTGWDIFHLGPFLLTKLENLKILKPLMEFFAWLWVEENVKDLGRHWEVLKDIPGLQLTLWSNPFVSTSTSPSLGDLNLRHFETWKVKVIGVCLPYFCHTFPEIFPVAF